MVTWLAQKSLWMISVEPPPMWSYCESPLVDGDHVDLYSGAADALMVALDKLDGDDGKT
ncbi:MAG: hypothetical protein R3B96_17815 [Pirellulaceae bacterium]